MTARSGSSRNSVSGLVGIAIFIAVIIAIGYSNISDSMSSSSKSMDIRDVSIEAQILDDGTAVVSESRQIHFNGDYSVIWWNLSEKSFDSITVDGVSITDSDGSTRNLSSVEFNTYWRYNGDPGYESYSVDEYSTSGGYNSVDPYVFSDFADGTSCTVTLNYTIYGAIDVYSDVAELYWQMIGSDSDVGISHLSATVSLPLALGDEVSVGENVRIWAHGPLNGTISCDENAVISLEVNNVPSNTYIEVRSTFPTTWVEEYTGTVSDDEMLSYIIAEEQQWADEANAQRVQALIQMAVYIGGSLLIFVVMLILWFKFGKDHKPVFQEKYFRDIPSDLHPAIISTLWKKGTIDSTTFTATLMNLSARGRLEIERVLTNPTFGNKQKSDYILKAKNAVNAEQDDYIDTMALNYVFNEVGAGSDTVAMSSFKTAAKSKGQGTKLYKSIQKWNSIVKDRFKSEAMYEKTSERLSYLGFVLGVVSSLLTLSAFLSYEFIIAIICLLLTIGTFILAQIMRRLTPQAAETMARCKALKNWLEDFTNLQEAIPTDVLLWKKMLVYSVIFGISAKVAKQLETRFPEMLDDPNILPVWMWVNVGHSGHASAVQQMSVSYNSVFASGSSGSSSGGGGGGGFSGGGGGGGGGGGFGGR